MLPLYVRNVLHSGRTARLANGVSAIGAFLGSLGLLSVAREKRLKFMSGNVLAISLGRVGFVRVQAFCSPSAMGY